MRVVAHATEHCFHRILPTVYALQKEKLKVKVPETTVCPFC